MSRLIPATERILRARQFIKQVHDLPVPIEGGRRDFSYIANVKDLLQQARDLIKFIPLTPSATDEMKEEVKQIYKEMEKADQKLLH